MALNNPKPVQSWCVILQSFMKKNRKELVGELVLGFGLDDQEASDAIGNLPIVIVDQRSFLVTAHRRSLRSSLLTVVADDREQWSFEVAGWRPWSCGVSWGEFYIWTARQLIVFPSSATEPTTSDMDEDLLFVFKVDLGWLAVCETSVRLLTGQGELARVECSDVIETARWESGRLVVLEQSGAKIAVAVKGGDLVTEPVDGQ